MGCNRSPTLTKTSLNRRPILAKTNVTNRTAANFAAKPQLSNVEGMKGASQLALAVRPTSADLTAHAELLRGLGSACRRYRLILARLRLAKTRKAELNIYTAYAVLIAMGEDR